MKKIITAICLLILAYGQGFAHKKCAGIYLSEEDYKQNKLSIIADTAKCKKAIKTDNFFCKPYITIQTVNGKLRIHKDSVFAIRTKKNEIFRIENEKNYQLLDSSNLFIYKLEIIISVPKKTLYTTRFEKETVAKYYFSTSKTGKIIELNLTNVRLACMKKNKDCQLVKQFPEQEDLCKQNESGQFLINEFFNKEHKTTK